MSKKQKELFDEEMSVEELDALIEKDGDVEQEADIMAEAVANAAAETVEEAVPTETEAIKEVEDEKKNPYQVDFFKEYEFSGKKIQSVDLSGMNDLTTEDAEKFDRIMARLGLNTPSKLEDTTYTKLVAMKVTGLPVEFFNKLSIRDMRLVTVKVYNFFLFG